MIGNMLHFLIASSLPVGLMWMMWKLNAWRWSRLADAYPAFGVVSLRACSAG